MEKCVEQGILKPPIVIQFCRDFYYVDKKLCYAKF